VSKRGEEEIEGRRRSKVEGRRRSRACLLFSFLVRSVFALFAVLSLACWLTHNVRTSYASLGWVEEKRREKKRREEAEAEKRTIESDMRRRSSSSWNPEIDSLFFLSPILCIFPTRFALLPQRRVPLSTERSRCSL